MCLPSQSKPEKHNQEIISIHRTSEYTFRALRLATQDIHWFAKQNGARFFLKFGRIKLLIFLSLAIHWFGMY